MRSSPGLSVANPHAGASPRLLFVRTDRLGETLLNLPTVRALRQHLLQGYLILMVQPSLQELLDGYPDVDEVVAEPVLRGSWWRRAWRLGTLWRSWNLETVLISNPKKEYHLAAWLAGIRRRIGYDRKWGFCLSHRIPDRKALGERHEVEYNLELLKPLGISGSPSSSPWLPIREQEEASISQLLGELDVKDPTTVVALHPWTSNPQKQWSVDRFEALIHKLREIPRVVVALIGGEEERVHVGRLGKTIEAGALDLVGRLSLRQLAAFFRRVRVLVSNDSGPVHLAAAVGIPTVVLFGTRDPATGPTRWGPWGNDHTVIWKPSLDAIEVNEVFEAVRRYLV